MFPGALFSRADWIRTSDLYTPSVARYQTTLQPEGDILAFEIGLTTGSAPSGQKVFGTKPRVPSSNSAGVSDSVLDARLL